MLDLSRRVARALAASLVVAALGCLASAAPAAADNSMGGMRRPLVEAASQGNLSRPGFPDGINSATADDSSGGLRRPLAP